MFIVIEKIFYLNEETGNFIQEDTLITSIIFESPEKANEHIKSRMILYSTKYLDFVEVSERKFLYTFVNEQMYREFSIARIESVSPEENLDVLKNRIQRAVKVLKEAERYIVQPGSRNFVEWYQNADGYAIETKHADAALSILEGNDDPE